MTEADKKTKVWFADSQKGVQKAVVDGKTVPYGKKNAIELTDSQLKRLRDSGVTDLQSE